jgi:hypothetical protein
MIPLDIGLLYITTLTFFSIVLGLISSDLQSCEKKDKLLSAIPNLYKKTLYAYYNYRPTVCNDDPAKCEFTPPSTLTPPNLLPTRQGIAHTITENLAFKAAINLVSIKFNFDMLLQIFK